MKWIMGVLLLVSMPAHGNEHWHPSKDARGVPLTVIVETVPKSAVLVRCAKTNRPSFACASIGPQGCHIIMPEPDTTPPSIFWQKVLGHELMHCVWGKYHD